MSLLADIALGVVVIIFIMGFFMGVPPMTWGERFGLLLMLVGLPLLYWLILKITGAI